MNDFNYIGIKDINGNKIYADSSIVEYDFRYFEEDIYIKIIGFVTYEKQYACYVIRGLESSNFLIDFICKDDIKNIKIIDTIQENKLGLMNDK